MARFRELKRDKVSGDRRITVKEREVNSLFIILPSF